MGSNPSTKTTICGGNGGANGKRNHVIVHSWITLCRVFMAEQHRKRELQRPKLPFDPQNLANDHRTLEFQDFKLVYLNSKRLTLHYTCSPSCLGSIHALLPLPVTTSHRMITCQVECWMPRYCGGTNVPPVASAHL